MDGPTNYDTIAARYAAQIDERPWNALYERPTTLALLPDVSQKDVLDAGCGPGWYADWLVRQGARVVAVDSSRSMVELADRRLSGRACVLNADVRELRGLIPEGAFDLVLSSLVLHIWMTSRKSSSNGRAFLDRAERWCFQLIIPSTKHRCWIRDTCGRR
ncbi:class I SAM-dependent methyltransferase [Bradyrhizobium sp. 180]|nr:class I SAM-dependent methyltransferase [Bradyrhizobium sp. 180]